MITYAAINLTNKKFQVGSTVNFEARQSQHLNGKGDLEFQRSLRKNPDNFFWLVSTDDNLETRDEEQFYLDFYCGSKWCYNHNPSASCPPSPKGKTWNWGDSAKEKWKGDGNPMWGKTTSQKQKDSVPKGVDHPSARKLLLIHPDGTEEVFEYAQLAIDKYNLHQGNLASVARGERKQHKGFRARYI